MKNLLKLSLIVLTISIIQCYASDDQEPFSALTVHSLPYTSPIIFEISQQETAIREFSQQEKVEPEVIRTTVQITNQGEILKRQLNNCNKAREATQQVINSNSKNSQTILLNTIETLNTNEEYLMINAGAVQAQIKILQNMLNQMQQEQTKTNTVKNIALSLYKSNESKIQQQESNIDADVDEGSSNKDTGTPKIKTQTESPTDQSSNQDKRKTLTPKNRTNFTSKTPSRLSTDSSAKKSPNQDKRNSASPRTKSVTPSRISRQVLSSSEGQSSNQRKKTILHMYPKTNVSQSKS